MKPKATCTANLHTSRYSKSSNNVSVIPNKGDDMRDFEQHTGQLDITEQAAAMETNSAPHQIIITAPEASRHVSIKTVIAVGAACLTIGGGYAATEQFFHIGSGIVGDIGQFIKAGAPHTVVTETQAMNELTNISLPESTIVAQGTGLGSSNVEMEKQSSGVPIFSWGWNTFAGPLAKMTTGVELTADAQVIAPPDAVTFSPYRVAGANPDNPWGVQVTVNASELSLQEASPVYVLDSSGQPVVPSSDGLGLRAINVFTDNLSDSTRTADVTTISEASFLNSCGDSLTPYLSASFQKVVRGYYDHFKQVLSVVPGAVKSLKQMMQEPMQVVFKQNTTNASGEVNASYISPSQITFPKQAFPTRQAFATDFNALKNSVHMNGTGDECLYAPSAVAAQDRILALSNATSTSTEKKVSP
jgi:hypothetical protein